MADLQPATSIPTTTQQTPQIPTQEVDFFGGGEDAFKNAIAPNSNQETPVVASAPFVPEESAWEPTIPSEPSTVEG